MGKVIRIILLSLLGLVVISYFVLVYFFQFYFIPGTTINGVDCSFKTPSFVEESIKQNPSIYTLDIEFRDGTQTITGDSIGLLYDYYTGIDEIKSSQNPFLWFELYKEKNYETYRTLSFREELLNRVVDGFSQLNPDNMIAPENPVIEMNDEGEVVATIKEEGNTITDIDGLKERIIDAINDEETYINVEDEGFYAGPEYPVESYSVQRCLEFCNTISNLKIYYIYGDMEIPFSRRQLYDTIVINDTYGTAISKKKTEDVLKRYSWLHDTYDKDRVFRTHNRQYINVHGEYYGWQIDIEQEVDLLYSDLIHERNVSRTPIFSSEGYVYTEKNSDIGDTYVEVDLTNQHVYYYQDGKMTMESDCVTGGLNRRLPTPPGLYYVYYKQSPSLLTGGETPVWVDYWMPFNRGIGLHDASWRWKFGGDIYTYNGSHGCVNLPHSFARDLYYQIEAGTPVVVY